ncbi:MAG: hypothetical protein ACOYLE_09630 [Bacteroidales bacterium]
MTKVRGKYFFILTELTEKNVVEIYQYQFNSWLLKYSDEVYYNDKLVEDRLQCNPNFVGNEIKTSNIKDGFKLKEINFIDQQIKHYKPIYEDTKGDNKNLTVHSKVIIYLDYLNKIRIEKFEKLICQPKVKGLPDKQDYKTFENMFVDNVNAEKVINELIDYETLNKQGELIKSFYEVLAITEALHTLGILKKDANQTRRNTLFGNKIKAKFSDKTTRAKSKNHNELVTGYKDLFGRLL